MVRRWRRFPAAARVLHARAEAKLLEAREASSGLRLRRGWCLRLRLDERNTVIVLNARDGQLHHKINDLGSESQEIKFPKMETFLK